MSFILRIALLSVLAAGPDAGAPSSVFARDQDFVTDLLGGVVGPDGGTQASPGPRGSLDKEIIRRVIRRHINEVRWCYESELSKDPLLGGRVTVRFTIAASGQISASALESSTMGNARVESCVVQAVRRWEFPKPLGGGVVNVSYPFVLTPAPLPLVPGTEGAGAVQIEWIDDRLLIHHSTDAQAVPANGLIAITDRGLVLVDTGWTEDQTEAILRFGQDRLHRTWIGAVITHDHADRDGGVGALLRRGIPVAAVDLTVAKLERRGVRGVRRLFAAAAGHIADERGFEAFYPGPGHAPDNIVVAFPRSNVVFGGCLIKSSVAKDLGFTGDADRNAWPAAVRRVAERYPQPRALVPGHGPVDRGTTPYEHTLELLGQAAPKANR